MDYARRKAADDAIEEIMTVGKLTIVGDKRHGFAILENGGLLYDFLTTRAEAEQIVSAIKEAGTTDWGVIQSKVKKS